MKRVLHWCWQVITAFLDNNLGMHAAGLTYFSLLAIVPILCCLLYFAKVCHVDQYARARIDEQLDTMITSIEKGQEDQMAVLANYLTRGTGEVREERKIAALEFGRAARSITNQLFDRIDNFDIGTLGWVGFGFLLWTLISSLSMVESSLNLVWGAQSRPIWKRIYLYLAVMILLPLFVSLAMSVPALKVVKEALGGHLLGILDSFWVRLFIAGLLSSLGFAFLFWALPNCPVSWRSAWPGGLFTALLFGGWIKICAIAQVGIANSSALYGSFAILPIVLAWLYMSWQIVLFGAVVVHELEMSRNKKQGVGKI